MEAQSSHIISIQVHKEINKNLRKIAGISWYHQLWLPAQLYQFLAPAPHPGHNQSGNDLKYQHSEGSYHPLFLLMISSRSRHSPIHMELFNVVVLKAANSRMSFGAAQAHLQTLAPLIVISQPTEQRGPEQMLGLWREQLAFHTLELAPLHCCFSCRPMVVTCPFSKAQYSEVAASLFFFSSPGRRQPGDTPIILLFAFVLTFPFFTTILRAAACGQCVLFSYSWLPLIPGIKQ